MREALDELLRHATHNLVVGEITRTQAIINCEDCREKVMTVTQKPRCQIIELIGSGHTLESAIYDAVHKSDRPVHSVDIKGFTLKLFRDKDDPGTITYEFRADCKLAVD